ncbi:hypothetical protein Cgig2_005474 [Carnegiea gigantea]|uniref:Pre-mRNA 3'-end-processing endonuclease polyadenylation factor C-term domain-containing protein n=1 Tax=Carnegiea gigantea TaxID=171969 RepID=A0A9Q1QFR6_9CARY|nr:hypothetical protein Cgig2_005474 [Carnegiea gigantea]
MYFSSEKMAKAIGKLAEKTPEVANINQRITIPYSGAFGVLKHRLKQMYESVDSGVDEDSDVTTLRVHDRVTIKQESDNHVSLHWTADPISDMVSDSIVALILNMTREMPQVVVESEAVKTEEENEKKMEKVAHALLVSLFGDVKLGEDGKLVIIVDSNVAYLDKQSGDVESENEGLKERVRIAFRRIQSAVRPIPLSAA